MKQILVTGGAGFIGSHLAITLKQKYPRYRIMALDNLRRRGSELNLSRLNENGIQFFHGDIRNPEDFNGIGPVSVVVECSADPSILTGICSDPLATVQNNFLGTVHCLNFALRSKADFIFLSSSRIYPIPALCKLSYTEGESRFILNDHQLYAGVSARGVSEAFPLTGYRSFYGATKLASELLIQEYRQFYKLRTVINRCGVITGPWQMARVDQGFVALWVTKHFWKDPLSYCGYGGEGKQVRDILHVEDLFQLIDFELHHMDRLDGEVFNVGGGHEVSVSLMELTALCQKVTGNKTSIKKVKTNRPADIPLYLSDCTKVTQATGWKPKKTPEEIVKDIHSWLKKNSRSLEGVVRPAKQ